MLSSVSLSSCHFPNRLIILLYAYRLFSRAPFAAGAWRRNNTPPRRNTGTHMRIGGLGMCGETVIVMEKTVIFVGPARDPSPFSYTASHRKIDHYRLLILQNINWLRSQLWKAKMVLKISLLYARGTLYENIIEIVFKIIASQYVLLISL